MPPDFVITQTDDTDRAYTEIWKPLLAFNQQIVGNAEGVGFALLITPQGSDDISGGLWGLSLWGSFYIGLTFVPEALRGTGVGSGLMQRAETEAISRDCQTMWVDTYEFQAREFYERHGFKVFGQIDGPAPMFPRYFMKKNL
ncbi:MAG: GNAT family N-acetyltransferase [Alphaproteobacteria bacterium]|nr:MAG: GNAT family N-acetyltransferase [Alphaproteobacteria bacterium]